jgi:hypothetical protein
MPSGRLQGQPLGVGNIKNRSNTMTEYITLRGKTVTDCIVETDTVVITFSDGSYVTITTPDKLKLIQYKSFMETLNG